MMSNHDQDHHGPSSENGHHDDQGKMMNNGKKKNEKTMLRTPADIYEYHSYYSFILDMPGLDALNIKVKVENGILHVTGKKKKQQMGGATTTTMTTNGNNNEEGVKVIRIERRRARYMRKFTLPADASHEDVKATYKDGVLSITVPKKLLLLVQNSNTTNPLTNIVIS